MQNLTSFSFWCETPPKKKKIKKKNEQVKYDLKFKLLDINFFLDKNGKINYSYSVQQLPGSCNIVLLT